MKRAALLLLAKCSFKYDLSVPLKIRTTFQTS